MFSPGGLSLGQLAGQAHLLALEGPYDQEAAAANSTQGTNSSSGSGSGAMDLGGASFDAPAPGVDVGGVLGAHAASLVVTLVLAGRGGEVQQLAGLMRVQVRPTGGDFSAICKHSAYSYSAR